MRQLAVASAADIAAVAVGIALDEPVLQAAGFAAADQHKRQDPEQRLLQPQERHLVLDEVAVAEAAAFVVRFEVAAISFAALD